MLLMNEMRTVKILFFATLRDRAGTRSVEVEIPSGAHVRDLKQILIDRFPTLLPGLNSALVAVNREFSTDEDTIPPEAEIAFFPPVSGGSGQAASQVDGSKAAGQQYPTIYLITEGELDLDHLIAEITLPTTGAACVFTGIVRGITKRDHPHQTDFLEYEAYRPMAETKMRQVAEEIRARWPAVEGIALVQRIGVLYPGTPTVLIACSAPHRDTGIFDAARYGIDRLKEIVPVWKKEVCPDGQTWVEGEYIPRPGE